MERPNKLSATFVKTVSQPGRYGDGRGGHGLSLLVKPSSTGRVRRIWCQRLRIGGKPQDLGLGIYPVTTLAEARAKALANRRAVEHGKDPRAKVSTIPAFSQAFETVLELHRPNWKNDRVADQWRSSIDAYAMPMLGNKAVSEITTSDIMAVLSPIWLSKKETARKLRQRLGMVMKWAVAQGYREDNPAGEAIGAALPKPTQQVEHQRALPFNEVGTALETIRQTNAWPGTKLAFEFLVLTAARSGEVRLAMWEEMDLDSSTWTVPASRVKTGRSHRIPLSTQAVAVLERAKELEDGSGLVFPSQRGKALTDSTVSKLLRESRVGAVPHGFRSSFRDWAAECSNTPREIAEFALGHIEGSAAELAYRRTDFYEARRELMEAWGKYVSQTQVGP